MLVPGLGAATEYLTQATRGRVCLTQGLHPEVTSVGGHKVTVGGTGGHVGGAGVDLEGEVTDGRRSQGLKVMVARGCSRSICRQEVECWRRAHFLFVPSGILLLDRRYPDLQGAFPL